MTMTMSLGMAMISAQPFRRVTKDKVNVYCAVLGILGVPPGLD